MALSIKVDTRGANQLLDRKLKFLRNMQPLEDAAREGERRMRAAAPIGKTGALRAGVRRYRRVYPARSNLPRMIRVGVTNDAKNRAGKNYAFILNNWRLSAHYGWAQRATAGIGENVRRKIEQGLLRA